MRLLLIRHGQTPGNVLGQLDTAHPGPGLTELGERQAAALARSLANEQIDSLYASTLIRTQITAAPLSSARGLEIEVLEGLHEIEAGSLEKLTDKASHLRYLGTVFGWADGELDRRMPGGPSGHEFFERYDASIARIAAAAASGTGAASGGAGTVAVVSHGAAIRVWAGLRVTQHGGGLRRPPCPRQYRDCRAGRGSRRRLAAHPLGRQPRGRPGAGGSDGGGPHRPHAVAEFSEP